MTPAQAFRVVESLRKGIPPDGFVRHFTVGRALEIKTLQAKLAAARQTALLLQANYGSGKTHLLRFIREAALELQFAISIVCIDSKSGIRFNRMDQILGAVCRNLEVPDAGGQIGLRPFFDRVADRLEAARADGDGSDFWRAVTNDWKWDYSETLDAAATFVAVRAWSTRHPGAQDLVEDWFYQPAAYKTQRKKLYEALVSQMRQRFRDPRFDWQFYRDDVFTFDKHGYAQSWAALRDLHRLARATGLKGLVLLFDEFEDVITNLNRVDFQQAAFWNLFQFYSGKQFPGMTFYAVTPEFTSKCKERLLSKGCWDYDYSQFDAIPQFQMSPLACSELEALADRILEAHGRAYGWEPDTIMKASQLDSIVRKAAAVPVQDRARHTITSVVKFLDRLFEDQT